MLSLLLLILFISVFFNLFGLAIKAAWGITKIFLFLVILPFMLIGMIIKGLVVLAVPVLLIVGIATVARTVVRA